MSRLGRILARNGHSGVKDRVRRGGPRLGLVDERDPRGLTQVWSRRVFVNIGQVLLPQDPRVFQQNS